MDLIPYYYDLFVLLLIQIITYILFVSSETSVDILLNCVAVAFLAEMDEFCGDFVNKIVTVSIIRELVFMKIDKLKGKPEFNEFEEICIICKNIPFFDPVNNSTADSLKILGYANDKENLINLMKNENCILDQFIIKYLGNVTFEDVKQMMITSPRIEEDEYENVNVGKWNFIRYLIFAGFTLTTEICI